MNGRITDYHKNEKTALAVLLLRIIYFQHLPAGLRKALHCCPELDELVTDDSPLEQRASELRAPARVVT